MRAKYYVQISNFNCMPFWGVVVTMNHKGRDCKSFSPMFKQESIKPTKSMINRVKRILKKDLIEFVKDKKVQKTFLEKPYFERLDETVKLLREGGVPL